MTIIPKVLVLLFVSISALGQDSLVWSDEFDKTGFPDPEKWTFDLGNGCPGNCGWGNNELQYYTNHPSNSRVEDGQLIIETHFNAEDPVSYTSAKLITRGIGSWKYARIEVAAKLPKGRGTWPAIWMLPEEWKYGGWPKSGEIDIMEHVGFDQNRVHGTVHTESFNHAIGTQNGNNVVVKDVADEFHVYAIDWTAEKIDFFIDGELYHTFEKLSDNPADWPFDDPFYLIFNIAVGGDWGGQEGVDETIWPQTLTIDYVRVYQ